MLLTIAGAGNGTVTSVPPGINCTATCSVDFATGTNVTLTAVPAGGTLFSGWSGACTGAASCQVTMDADRSVTATFTAIPTFTLTVSKDGTGTGTVTSAGGINCGSSCSTSLLNGTQVTLTAASSAGSVFIGWSGGGCSGNAPCTLTIGADTTVTATFDLRPTFALALTITGTGSGTISSVPSGINCTASCSGNFAQSDAVTLTASPSTGSIFAGWSGACVGLTCSVTMDAAKAVTATFTVQSYTLTVTTSGASTGTVTSNPVGISCGNTCSAAFTHGTNVALTPAPATDYAFTSWSGACTGSGACTVAMTSARSVSATFTAQPHTLAVAPVVSALSNPLLLTAPASDSRLFIVEKPGRIRIIENGNLLPTSFLSLVGQVSGDFEQGLLGLAFHPSYASNGYFYVYYTALNGDIRVERYTVSANANVAEAASAHLVITVPHSSQTNHNGGMLAFGTDGKLYIGTGDGGGGGDPDENGQNLGVLLGKLLRIDVDTGDPYAIPSNNPFVNTAGARGEIWALGLRNPWRWAFDRTAGHLYIADVGQGAWEEVNVVSNITAGLNYGWDVMEGRHCYDPSSGCNQSGLTLPVLEYGHTGGACSISGGFVYRGVAIPALQGTYFYADYCAGWVRSFRYANGAATEQQEWDFGNLGNILSFGEDAAGEVYILSSNGTVYKIVPAP